MKINGNIKTASIKVCKENENAYVYCSINTRLILNVSNIEFGMKKSTCMNVGGKKG